MANKKFLVPIGLASLSSDPASGVEGDIYYNNVSDGIRLYKNGAWTDLMASGALPSGGASGQILAKSSNTDYAVEWIENYADYTETVKHKVKNGSGVALYQGQPVYVSGSDGTNVLVSKANNSGESTSSQTLGLLAQNLADNGQGFVITSGKLGGLDTSTASLGDPVWLGSNGALLFGMANKPSAPAHLVYLGVVTKVNGSTGEIFVKVQNGYELEELHNIGIGYGATIGDNEVLAYDTTSGLWINQTAGEANLVTLNGTETLSNKTISDSLYFNNGGNTSSIYAGGNDFTVYGYNDLYLNTNNGNIILQPDGFAYIYSERIATQEYVSSYYQPLDADLTAIAGIAGTSGLLKKTAADTWTLDTNTYLTTSSASSTYQPLDTDLTNIAALTGTSGFLKTDGANGWTVDTNTYATAGDISSAVGDYIPLTEKGEPLGVAELDIDGYVPIAQLPDLSDTYLTTSSASSTYAPKANPLVSNLNVTGYTIIQSEYANPTTFKGDEPTIRFKDTTSSKFMYFQAVGGSLTYNSTVQFKETNGLTSVVAFESDLVDFITEEVDPVFVASPAYGITSQNKIDWQAAFDWGNHASAGYLTSYTETDTLASVTGRSGGATTSSAITITNTTQSTNKDTGALIVDGGVGIEKDVRIGGSLYITGNVDITGSITGSLTEVSVTNLNVTDSVIYLANQNFNSDILDIGFYGAYGITGHTGGSHYHTGLVRDHTDGKWKLFSAGTEPTGSTVDLTGVTYDTLKLGTLEATSVPTVGTITSGTWNGSVIGASYIDTAIARLNSPQFTGTVSGITKSMVGLGNVDNTSDANKPVSTATQTALNLKANLISPEFTTPSLGVATATSINGTSIPSSKTLLISDNIGSTVQAFDQDLADIAALTGDGIARKTTGVWAMDNNTYLTTGTASSTYAPIASPSFTTKITTPAIELDSGLVNIDTSSVIINDTSSTTLFTDTIPYTTAEYKVQLTESNDFAPTIPTSPTTTFASGSGTKTINLPSGIIAGELILIAIRVGGSATPPTISGYNTVAGSTSKMKFYYKIAVGSDANPTFSGSASGGYSIIAYRISNWYGSNSGIKSGSYSSTIDPPSVTSNVTENTSPTATAQYLAIAFESHLGTGTVTAAPSGYSALTTSYEPVYTEYIASSHISLVSSGASTANPGTFTTTGTTGTIESNTVIIAPKRTNNYRISTIIAHSSGNLSEYGILENSSNSIPSILDFTNGTGILTGYFSSASTNPVIAKIVRTGIV